MNSLDLNKFLRIIFLPLDIITALLISIISIVIIPLIPRNKSPFNILISIMPANSSEIAKAKFGTGWEKRHFEEHIGGLFKEVWIYNYPMPTKRQTIVIKDESKSSTIFFVERFPFLKLLYISGAAALILEMSFRIKISGAQLIRARDPLVIGLIGWATSKLSGIPFVVSMHTDYEHLFKIDPRHAPKVPGGVKMLFAIAGFVFRRAHRIYPIRESIGRWPKRLGTPKEKIQIIPHGIDLTNFTTPVINIKNEFGIPEKAQMIFSCGRIASDNYFHHITKIAEIVTANDASAVFVIAGEGWELEKLKEETNEKGLSNSVKWIGSISNSKAADFWKASAIGLVMKGGFSLIEAAAAGIPLVSYDIEWHYELVINNKTGRLVKPHPEDAASAIIELLSLSEEERMKLGTAAKELAFSRHSMEASVAIKRRIFEDAMKK